MQNQAVAEQTSQINSLRSALQQQRAQLQATTAQLAAAQAAAEQTAAQGESQPPLSASTDVVRSTRAFLAKVPKPEFYIGTHYELVLLQWQHHVAQNRICSVCQQNTRSRLPPLF